MALGAQPLRKQSIQIGTETFGLSGGLKDLDHQLLASSAGISRTDTILFGLRVTVVPTYMLGIPSRTPKGWL
jgi:hypothetical protein